MNKNSKLSGHQLYIASIFVVGFMSLIISAGIPYQAHAVFQPGNNEAPASPTKTNETSSHALDQNESKSSSTESNEQSMVSAPTLIVGGGLVLILAIVGIRYLKNKK